METLVFEWPTGVQKKIANGIGSEDYAAWDDKRGYWIVADGVTRDVYSKNGYSLAQEAAKLAAIAMANKLAVDNSEQALEIAFQLANSAVMELNKKAGLWGEGNNNYLDHDLAGTCLAGLVRVGGNFFYGLVGDCRLACLANDGKLDMVPDQVLAARAEFPKDLKPVERTVVIRKERRNNPLDPHRTYGVLTGEETALDPKYLIQGSYICKPGDVLIVCSDGAAPFVENDREFTHMLLAGSVEEIQQYVANPESPYQNTDEKTLILIRV